MDILRRGNEHLDDDVSHTAPGIETPPMVGGDERRMHVRAYNFWAKLLEGRSFPAIDALDLDDLGDFGPNSLLLDFTSGIDNPAISFIGDALALECELDGEVNYIADVPRRSLLSRLTDHYLQIIANRAPIGFEAEFINAKGATILYRGVLLPFSSDDDTIDFILGVINWKQAAEPELAAAIADEMEAATIAPPPQRATVPVWADGPEAAIADTADLAAAPDDADRFASYDDETYDLLPEQTHGAMIPDSFAGLVRKPVHGAVAAIDGLTDDLADTVADDDADASLADRLASARLLADVAAQANVRGHQALYAAIGRAWGFAAAAADAPDDYAELLSEAGIADSPRSPMTPVAKLVFGSQHDKTRLAEVAAVLTHAAREAIDPGALPGYLARYAGGLKGLLRDVRAAGKSETPATDPIAGIADALRRATPLAMVDLPFTNDDAEFVVLVARRLADGSHAVISQIPAEESASRHALRAAAKGLRRRR